jgi:hypothetical protein
MEKKLSLSELVKRYLAQPFTNFNYPDTSSDTPEEKKEEETKIPTPIYIPPSGDGGGGGIGSLGGGDGTFIGGGATLEDAGGTYPGGYHSAEGGLEFTGGDGEITADGPGFGTMGTTGYGSGQDLGGGEITADGPGYGTMGTGIGGMGLGEFTADGPGFGTMGTGIGGGQGLGADANDGFADGQDFGADANDGFANDGFGDYSDFDDGTMTGSAGQGGDYGLGPSGLSAPGSQANSPGNPANQGGGSGDGCFIKGTLITMADGSTKPVEQVDLEDQVAVGGKVFAVGRFLNTELYDYKGIKVSGSHMVNEDGVWMRVRDTKHGKSLGDDKNTVYVFGSENRRILINKILFTDYFEVNEQDILIEDSEDFFNNSKSYGKIIDKQNVDILNAS